jgi:tetratricopeptide (TPR) repeat protein
MATLAGHRGGVTGVACDPNGKWIVSAGEDHHAILWNAATARAAAVLQGHADSLTCVAFSPNGRFLATAGKDQRVILWEVISGEHANPAIVLRHTLRGHAEPINSVAFSPDGRRLASAGLDLFVKVWDVATGHEAISLSHVGGPCPDVAFSPDGNHLVAAQGARVMIWSVRDQSRSAADAGGDADHVANVVWHRDQAGACEGSGNWFGAAWHWSRMIEKDPKRPEHFVRRGNARVRLGHWQRASEDYAQAMKLGADDPLDRHCHALLLLRKGDQRAYQEFCTRLLESHLDVEDEGTANGIAWTCALAPRSVEEYAPVLKLSELAVARCKPAKAYMRLNTYGGLLYRAGRYNAAIEMLNQSMIAHGDGGTPQDWIFLAMAHHRLGQGDHASQWLTKARQWLDKAVHDDSGRADVKSLRVWECLEIELLLHEAEQYLATYPAR